MKRMNGAKAAERIDTVAVSAEPAKHSYFIPPVRVPDSLVTFDFMPDSAYVRLPVVTKLFGVSRATVWRWSKMGKITATRLAEKTTGWNVGNLRKVLKGQV